MSATRRRNHHAERDDYTYRARRLMANITSPIRFVPFLRPLVWGGRKLASLHKDLPTPDNYGESWEVSDHPLHQSVVAEGPLAGVSLRELLQTQSEQLLGQASLRRFPWLIKFLDARDWLSVQVHPDDAKVANLWPGESGKTEAWFVVDAEPHSRIYAGLLPGVGQPEFRDALTHGDVAKLLASFEPKPGDCVFLPAGTVHALGGGVLLAEIQQTSDATFRLFDWNRIDAQGRPRQLHVQEGLAAIDWNQGAIQPIAVVEPCLQLLVSCAYFQMSYLHRVQPFTLEPTGSVQALIVLHGQAQANGVAMSAGQVWLVPASLPAITLQPEPVLTALHCTLPLMKEPS